MRYSIFIRRNFFCSILEALRVFIVVLYTFSSGCVRSQLDTQSVDSHILNLRYYNLVDLNVSKLPYPKKQLAIAAIHYNRYQFDESYEILKRLVKDCALLNDIDKEITLRLTLQIVRITMNAVQKSELKQCLHEKFSQDTIDNVDQFAHNNSHAKLPKVEPKNTIVMKTYPNVLGDKEDPYYVYYAFASEVNSERVPTLFDTGAENSLIDDSLINRFNLEATGKTIRSFGLDKSFESKEYTIPELKIEQSVLKNIYTKKHHTPDSLVLGQDVIQQYKYFSLDRNNIVLTDKFDFDDDTWIEVPMVFINGQICIFAKDQHGTILIHIDTGYSGQAVVSDSYYTSRLVKNAKQMLPNALIEPELINEMKSSRRLSFSFGGRNYSDVIKQETSFKSIAKGDISVTLGSAFLDKYMSKTVFNFEDMKLHFIPVN